MLDGVSDSPGSGIAAGGDARFFRAAIAIPPVFLLLHAIGNLYPMGRPDLIALGFQSLAPLAAAAACLIRGLRAERGGREGWFALALAMCLWSSAMVSLFAGAVRGQALDEGMVAILLFVLYGAPLTFMLASPRGDPWRVRLVDGLAAVALGVLFFLFVSEIVTLTGTDEAGGLTVAYMFDVQNAFIAIFAAIRYFASTGARERTLFATLAAFAVSYGATAGYWNHFLAYSPYGANVDLIIDVPFLLFVSIVLLLRLPPARSTGSGDFARAVRAGSPLMLPVSLITVSVALAFHHPVAAMAGCVTATIAYGLRMVLVQIDVLRERDRMAALSRIDALTGLPNRRQFDDALRRELTRARRTGQGIALLMIDIDHFKLLNETLGHATGDVRLRAVAHALQGCAARGTDVVARYGGEEFAAILPAARREEAAAVAEAMRAAVERAALASPAPAGHVTVSIGAARLDMVDGEAEAALIEAADRALYVAKREGRNRVALAWDDAPRLRVVV